MHACKTCPHYRIELGILNTFLQAKLLQNQFVRQPTTKCCFIQFKLCWKKIDYVAMKDNWIMLERKRSSGFRRIFTVAFHSLFYFR